MLNQKILSDIEDKSEDAYVQIAERAGHHLCNDAMPPADRRAAELLARALADDAIESARVALSRAVARAKHLPRDLALKLAHDVDSVACPFLEVTEVFSDSDWQQLVFSISRGACVAVARRQPLSECIASALAEVGDSIVTETLIENPTAPMTEAICYTIMDRFASEIWVLDKLASRNDLVSEVAVKLTTIVSAAMRQKLATTYNVPDLMEPVATEAETDALLQIVKKTPEIDLIHVCETLHKEGKLKPPLILTALCENQLAFTESALSVLSGRSLEHVRSVILRAGFDAVEQLLGRAQIPEELHAEFCKEVLIVRQKHK